MAPVRLALFDLDGTLLAGDTDVLWCAFLLDAGILDRKTFGAANRDVAERYARGRVNVWMPYVESETPTPESPWPDHGRRGLTRSQQFQ